MGVRVIISKMIQIIVACVLLTALDARGVKLRLETRDLEKRSILDLHQRPGQPTKTHSCNNVRAVPANLRTEMRLGLSDFYQQYTEAYGIPVLASQHVSKDAIKRACYVVRLLLADHAQIRRTIYKLSGRVAVIGLNEKTNDIPEHSKYDDAINDRSRGLGAEYDTPASSSGEENFLCYDGSKDKWPDEDFFVHEFAHAVHLIGARYTIPGFDMRLKRLYDERKKNDVQWKNTYAMTNHREMYAEAVQSFYGVNAYRAKNDGVHNDINTRAKLEQYDPELYNLLLETFPCKNTIIDRCNKDRDAENNQVLVMDCDTAITNTCSDTHVKDCPFWAGNGECENNPAWMSTNCPFACDTCTCQDSQATCSQLANAGECSSNKSWMSRNCKKSCGTCHCSDDDDDCDDWEAQGKCSSNPSYMSRVCKLSCGTCDCFDTNDKCHEWASWGECEKNPSWMHYNCKKSCNKCHCDDSASNCQTLSSQGQCSSNKSWMSGHCQLSCGTCDCYHEEDNCATLADSGGCQKDSANAAWMSMHCKKSCGTCSCQDYDTNCTKWRKAGECSKNPNWMNINCPWSCNQC